MADDSKVLTLAQCVLIESALANDIKQSNAGAEFAASCGADAAQRFWAERATALGEVLTLIADHTVVTVSGHVVREDSVAGTRPMTKSEKMGIGLVNGEY